MKLIASAVLVFATLPAFSAGLTCRVPNTPYGARVEMVAPDMRVQGSAMTMRIIESKLSVDELIGYYRDLWAPLATDKRPGSREDKAPGWRVISTIDGPCLNTVQVRAQGSGSYALLAVSQAQGTMERRNAQVTTFPALPGSKVLQDVEFVDGIRNSRTVVLTNTSNIAANQNFYVDAFRQRGWTQVMQGKADSTRGVHQVMVLKRGFEEINLVISPGPNGTVGVVANVVDRP
ncbi:hypothetical protein ACO2Q9_08665 [Variovorax sp. VNK109]|jgi:hypothetical protein|uniref:hypothetical protein n=1 Tax=Variovorax sp. VNK109 TaxID=3400919 RepID=UPI003C067B7D